MICNKLTEDHNPRINWCPFCRIAELEAERDWYKVERDAAYNRGLEALISQRECYQRGFAAGEVRGLERAKTKEIK